MSPKLKNQLLAVGALAVAAGALLFLTQSSLGQNLIYYWTPGEMLAQGSKAVGPVIRLGGIVEGGSVRWDEAKRLLHFRVCDGETTEKTCVPVQSSEVPPQMFRENIGVVIEGHLDKNHVFSSKRLMVNHSNEYQAPHDGKLPADWKSSVSESSSSPGAAAPAATP
jgi:cytochrome c-type biogenesis protein CcmE